MPGKNQGLRHLSPSELRKAKATDEQLTAALKSLRGYDGKYLHPAALAWAYQKGRLNDEEFTFLYYRKSFPHSKGDMSDKQRWWWSLLCKDLYTQLTKWEAGEPVIPKDRREPVEKPSAREMHERKMAARERNRLERKAKREALYGSQ